MAAVSELKESLENVFMLYIIVSKKSTSNGNIEIRISKALRMTINLIRNITYT